MSFITDDKSIESEPISIEAATQICELKIIDTIQIILGHK